MKITPIEIRQHTFQKVLRGYDVEEVSAFLTSLSNEWERVSNETKMMKMQLDLAEKELNKLRELESTMFRMLKTAEDTTAQMTEQAKNTAEQYIGEAKTKSEELIGEARKKAAFIVQEAERQAQVARDEVQADFKNQERDLKAMEKYRDNLLVQLKTLANNTNDSVERFEKKFANSNLKEKFEELKVKVEEPEIEKNITLEIQSAVDEAQEVAQPAEQENIVDEALSETTNNSVEEVKEESKGSFFDQL